MEHLAKYPVAVFRDSQDKRVCGHFIHSRCVEAATEELLKHATHVEGADQECPTCDTPYKTASNVPSPEENGDLWFRALDMNGDFNLSEDELVSGITAFLDVDGARLELLLDEHWEEW